MNDDGWDGRERRAMSPQAIAEQVIPVVKGTQNRQPISNTLMLIVSAVLAVLQCAALVQHALLSGDIRSEGRKQEAFRRTISCFLYEISRPPDTVDRADLLARCGLINVTPREEQ